MVVTIPPDLESLPDRIAEMLANSTVFITGGSGFLGKLLVEKILRQCPDVKVIYLLIRNKKGKTPFERMDDIFSNAVFKVLKAENAAALGKCQPIPGDVTQVNLGISPENRKLIQDQVEFIFHSAASTRFDETVRVAARMNTRGTKYMLDLAQGCKKLKVFVHISTAYSHPEEPYVKEMAYKPPADPNEILKSINFDLEDDSEEPIHLKLLKESPNTYTFTKALAEDLVVQSMDKLPTVIVRPSIVCPTWREPFTGWCNNLQGPMGLFVGAGKGIIRSMYCKGDNRADFMCADVVINALLASAWVHVNFDKSQRIYNVTASDKFAMTWEQIIELGRDIVTNHVPFNGVVWYPGGSLKKSRWVHQLCFFFFQIIPAIFIDAILVVLGYGRVLFPIQRRIQKGSEMFEYFTTTEWLFDNKQTMAMTRFMNDKEKEIYKLDGEGFEIVDYLCKAILSIRTNNLKETDDMLPAAKRHMKVMWALDVACKTLFIMAALYYTYKWILEPVFRI